MMEKFTRFWSGSVKPLFSTSTKAEIADKFTQIKADLLGQGRFTDKNNPLLIMGLVNWVFYPPKEHTH